MIRRFTAILFLFLIGGAPQLVYGSCQGAEKDDERCHCRERQTLPTPEMLTCQNDADCSTWESACGDWHAVSKKAIQQLNQDPKIRKIRAHDAPPKVHCYSGSCLTDDEYEWKKKYNN